MRPATIGLVLLLLLIAGVCARMGLWQRSRWMEKRAANAQLAAALAAPPVPLVGAGDLPLLVGRKVEATGEFDTTRHVLLSREGADGAMGVDVVTPLRLAGGGIVLVNRGWIATESAATISPSAFTRGGEQHLVALLQRVPSHATRLPWVRLDDARPERWSARGVDRDTLVARWPDVDARAQLVALPGGANAPLTPSTPEAFNEQEHLSYALQWTLFTVASLAGAVFVVTRRGKQAA
jgi:surfeit locus 1 family protein